MTGPAEDVIAAVADLAAQAAKAKPYRIAVIGMCGAQGSGKSTLARAVAGRLQAHGLPTAILSIDDIYLTRTERMALADRIHPLFATRGPPGTHDIRLGLHRIEQFAFEPQPRLPRFDKAHDDRAHQSDWADAPPDCRVLLFEGWCVGALAQPDTDLVEPVNSLEESEDPDGVWRKYANGALRGPYQELFAHLDRLVLLAAPDFEVVARWRTEQEAELAAQDPSAPGLMDSDAIARFVAHYERLTRHILSEMPNRADLVIPLDHQRRPIEIRPGNNS